MNFISLLNGMADYGLSGSNKLPPGYNFARTSPGKVIEKELIKNGWVLRNKKGGSHRQLVKRGRNVTVPSNNHPLSPKTYANIVSILNEVES